MLKVWLKFVLPLLKYRFFLGDCFLIGAPVVGGAAKHCVDQYMVLFCYCPLGVTLLCRTGYMLGFATHL